MGALTVLQIVQLAALVLGASKDVVDIVEALHRSGAPSDQPLSAEHAKAVLDVCNRLIHAAQTVSSHSANPVIAAVEIQQGR